MKKSLASSKALSFFALEDFGTGHNPGVNEICFLSRYKASLPAKHINATAFASRSVVKTPVSAVERKQVRSEKFYVRSLLRIAESEPQKFSSHFLLSLGK